MSEVRRRAPDERRRGWCPGLARPMPTGDGLLARIHPPGGRLSSDQLRAVARAARRHGNGLVDITSRANLQLRGVTEASSPALTRELAAADLRDARADGGPQRVTLTGPLAGLDAGSDLDAPALACAIESVALTVEGLPPKTLVAIDGGGRCGPGISGADILLVARAPGRIALGLAEPENPLWCGDNPVRQVPGLLGLAFTVFAATGKRRMRELDASERASVAAAAGCIAPTPRAYEPAALPAPGFVDLEGGRQAIVVEAPFGRCSAEQLESITGLAAADIRLTPSRGLVLVAARERSLVIRDTLASLGFVTEADDPRRAVAACPGAPACASGTTPVPDHAARLARAFAGFAARGIGAHVSGCAKGCAHPTAAALTLVAERGLYDVVLDGSPDGAPTTRLTFEAALERVRRADPGKPLAEAFGTSPL